MKHPLRRLGAIALLFCLLLLSACHLSAETTPISRTDIRSAEDWKTWFLRKADEVSVTEDSVIFTDANGTVFTVARSPQNVVILYASFTTLWYEAGGTVSGCLGGENAVELYREYIGRDITEDDHVRTLALSAMGKNWDVEGILSMQPDMILCSTAMNGYATLASPAAAAEIPLVAVDYNDFSDYLKWFRVFCHLSGHPELWETVALPALDDVVDTLVRCPVENAPTVFCMFSGADTLKANTSVTVLGGMITAMHAHNIADDWDTSLQAERMEINLETLYAADPDIIVIQCHAGNESARQLVESLYADNPIWQSLTAVREGRVYYLEKTLFHNKPNSRFADAYRTLATCLYPTEFSDS